jgi:alanyl-tRNA synthetase
MRVVVFVGKKARQKIKAGIIAKQISTQLGGSGGGDDKFGQGGAGSNERSKDRIEEALLSAEELVMKSVAG